MRQAPPPRDFLRLRIPEIEKTLMHVVIDLHEILVLDGVDLIADPPAYRLRSHDLYGLLPDILIHDTEDRYTVLERIPYEAAKLIAMVRVRQKLFGMFPGCEFLLPTSTDEGALVGMHFRGKTVLAEEKSHWEAYHKLVKEAGREIL